MIGDVLQKGEQHQPVLGPGANFVLILIWQRNNRFLHPPSRRTDFVRRDRENL